MSSRRDWPETLEGAEQFLSQRIAKGASTKEIMEITHRIQFLKNAQQKLNATELPQHQMHRNLPATDDSRKTPRGDDACSATRSPRLSQETRERAMIIFDAIAAGQPEIDLQVSYKQSPAIHWVVIQAIQTVHGGDYRTFFAEVTRSGSWGAHLVQVDLHGRGCFSADEWLAYFDRLHSHSTVREAEFVLSYLESRLRSKRDEAAAMSVTTIEELEELEDLEGLGAATTVSWKCFCLDVYLCACPGKEERDPCRTQGPRGSAEWSTRKLERAERARRQEVSLTIRSLLAHCWLARAQYHKRREVYRGQKEAVVVEGDSGPSLRFVTDREGIFSVTKHNKHEGESAVLGGV